MSKPKKIKLTANAITVLESRYLLRDISGGVVETPRELFSRVAQAVGEPEGTKRRLWTERFEELMSELRFLPNSPTLMNAGKDRGQLSACFVLPVQDSLESIFTTLKYAAMIHQSGGGTGFSFSSLRSRGSVVGSTSGVASGPVSFMRVFDSATEAIKQGGTRRGANMGILRVDHPDIFDFIDSKRDRISFSNFNISVAADAQFMRAVVSGSDYALRDPGTRKEVKIVSAKVLFSRIAHAAWESGDPGLVFLDRINAFNPTPALGGMESTNPCGEQPLLPYESCNLGSLNLSRYVKGRGLDWSMLRQDIRTAVRFLDNVIDINEYPVVECRYITQRNRKIGLGVMGFADLLLLLGIPYDSEEALRLGESAMAFIDREAKHESIRLATEKGPFPNWKGSLWHHLGYPKLRNATVSTVAPTGTISTIAGCSSGIEPIFAGIYRRNVLSGAQLLEIHPAVATVLHSKGVKPESLTEDQIERDLGRAWRPAKRIGVIDHVKMQAAFQRHSDSAVSKTINLPESATVEDVAQAYLTAYQAGCKGITIYRDKSRSTQVLEQVTHEEAPGNLCPSC